MPQDRTRNERQARWRERQRELGRSPLTVWLDENTIKRMNNLAHKHNTDTAGIVSIAIQIMEQIDHEKKQKKASKPKTESTISPTLSKKEELKKTIGELRERGLSYQEITNIFNKDEIPTLSGAEKWNRKMVSRVWNS